MAFSIQGMSHEGRGIAHANEEVWFIQNALPNEIVLAEKDSQKKRIVFAHATEWIKRHPERIEPPCPYFMQCGGCDLQMASPSLQQHIKQQIVQDALMRIGKIHHLTVSLPYRGKNFHYRNKGRFHLGFIDGKPTLGFFAKQSHRLIPVTGCLLFSETFCRTIQSIEDRLYLLGRELPEAITLRENRQGEQMLSIATHKTSKKLQQFFETIQHIPNVSSLWHEIPSKKGPHFVHQGGSKTLQEKIGNVVFHLSPGAFFQVNTEAAEALFETVRTIYPLEKHMHLLDLYSGVGAIGLYLASEVAQVTGVEPVGQAVEDARQTALRNHITNATYKKGYAEKWLPKALKEGLNAHLAIVDPPRSGLAATLIEALNQSGIPHLIYVSCNPSTLARDLQRLSPHYHAQNLSTIDMFPQTAHVETVVLLSRLNTK